MEKYQKTPLLWIIFVAIFAGGLAVFPQEARAVYPSTGLMSSTNLLAEESGSIALVGFTYTASLPAGTGLRVAFSQDGSRWRNAAGEALAWETMSDGTNVIDLSSANWNWVAGFYYKVEFTSDDGSATPVLDDVSLAFTASSDVYQEYYTSGTLTSENLLNGETVNLVDDFNYNASAIPAGTSLKARFSQDNATWYSSAGVEDAWDTLAVGENAVDLSGLEWGGANFYYQIEFTSDNSDTPVLDSVNVTFAENGLSGTVYAEDGTTPLGSQTVRVAINGTDHATTVESDASTGAWAINDLTYAAGDVITVYLEDETADAVAVTVSSESNITGLNLRQNYLTARQDNSGSLTNANLSTAAVADENDISNIYSVSGSDVTLADGKSLHVPASHTFAPGGDVKAGGSFVNEGTFTAGENAVMFNGASGSHTIDSGGQALNDLTLNDGLVGYWKFDETSAGTFADSSGYGNTGTGAGAGGTNNTPQPTETKPSLNFTNTRALDFDGTDDYVEVTDHVSINPEAITVSGWIKRNAIGIRDQILAKRSPSDINVTSYGLDVLPTNKLELYFNKDNTWTSPESTGTIGTDWTHVAATFDGTTARLYINGIVDGTESRDATMRITAEPLLIGKDAYGGDIMHGQIDDVRIYNRALSASEISALAAGNQPATSTATFTLADILDVNGNLVLATGNLDVSANNYAINVAGSWNNYGGVFTKRAGTVTLDSGSEAGMTVLSGGQQFNNLTVNGSGGSWTTADALSVGGDLTVTAGSLDISPYTATLTGAASVTDTLKVKGDETPSSWSINNGSTLEYKGSSTYTLPTTNYYHLTFNGGGTWSAAGDTTVNNDLTLTNGTFDLSGYNLTVTGNLAKTGGTLANTAGRTLTLDGSNQSLNAGDVTWDTVNVNGSSGTVTLGSNFSVSNLLSIAASKVMSLVSYTVNILASLLNLGEINEGTGQVAATSSSFYIADENYDNNPILTPESESQAYISLTDQDGNLNGQTPDTLTGTVVSCATDSETVTLTETGTATEVFRGSVNIAMYDGSATNNDGTLECNDGVQVTATYTDPQDNSDTQSDTATFSGQSLPSAPGSLTGTPGKTSIVWSWTDNSSNEDGFKLYDAANNTLIATPSSSPSGEGESPTVTYTETGLTKGTQYSRYLKSYNDAGYSSATSTVQVTTKAEPTAPSSFTGTAVSSTSITWSWTDNSDDETGFRLYDADGTLVATTPSSSPPSEGGETTTYTETGLTKNTTYQRYLTAYNEDGNSTATSTYSVTTLSTAPDTFSLISPASGSVTNSNLPTFTFEQTQDEDDGIASYTLILDSGHSFTIPVSSGASNPVSKTHYGSGFTAQYFNENDGDPTNDTIQVSLNAGSGLNFLPLSDGAHTWSVTAKDNGNNTRSAGERRLTVDATAPSLTACVVATQNPPNPPCQGGSEDVTTTDTRPTISITAEDATSGLKELTVTLSQKGLFGSYVARETRTYALSGNRQSVTYIPREELAVGQEYQVEVKALDQAGSSTDRQITFTVQTDQAQARADLSALDAGSASIDKIIEKLRATLPENPFNLNDMTYQAALRRQKQVEELSQFKSAVRQAFTPLYLFVRNNFINGQGRLERSLAGGLRSLSAGAQAVADTSRAVAVQAGVTLKGTAISLAQGIQETTLYLAGGAKQAVVLATAPVERLTSIDITGNMAKALQAVPLPDARDLENVQDKLAVVRHAGADLLEKGRENRTRVGLANRQKMERVIEGGLAYVGRPVKIYVKKVAIISKHAYEVMFDKETTAIMNIRVSYLSSTKATLEWDTNHLTRKTKVNYGTSNTSPWTNSAIDEDVGYKYSHKVVLESLNPDTLYYFEIMNQNGEYVYDAYYVLRTLPNESAPITEPLAPQDAVIKSKDDAVPTSEANEGDDGMTQNLPSPPYQGGNDDAPAYEQPNPESEIVRQLKVGERYRALQEKNGWVSLLIDLQEVWVKKENIDLLPQQQPSATASHSSWEE